MTYRESDPWPGSKPYPLPVRIAANVVAITVVFVLPVVALGAVVRRLTR